MTTKTFVGQVTAGNNVTVQADGTVSATVNSPQFDQVFGSQRGSIIFRDATQWRSLQPGNPGSNLFTGGPNADPAFGVNPYVLEVNVKTDFNAKGDGVTDDWAAIENARLYLVSKGGGRMFFPPGRYLLPTSGKNVTVSSNIEYCGAGASSIIVGSNCCFAGPNGANFNYPAFPSYTYYALNTWASGARQVVTTTPANAANFSAGKIVFIRSTQTLPPNGLPYFMEINRVKSVDAGTGAIVLEEPIDDAWALGAEIADVTSDFAANYSIHDLMLECADGHPLFLSGNYKSDIRNLWTHGLSVLVTNAWARCSIRDVNALVNWTGATKYSAIEVESASCRGIVEEINIAMYGAGSTSGMPLIYPQEFSRRCVFKGIRINASGTDIGDLIQPATAGGHYFEDIELHAKNMDTVFRYTAVDDTKSSLNGLGAVLRDVRVDCATFYGGLVLANLAVNGTVQNVRVDGVKVSGAFAAGDIGINLYQGAQQNHLFENCDIPGNIACNTTGIADPNIPDVGTLTYPLTNVVFDSCVYDQLDTQVMLQNAEFRNCRRRNMPKPHYNFSTLVWDNAAANTVVLSMTPAAATKFCWGDAFHVKASFDMQLAQLAVGAMHVRLVAFGVTVLTLDYALGGPDQMTEIDTVITLVNNTFKNPDKSVGSGRVAINAVDQPERVGYYFQAFANSGQPIQLQAWVTNHATQFITPMEAKITFIPVEDRARSGV